MIKFGQSDAVIRLDANILRSYKIIIYIYIYIYMMLTMKLYEQNKYILMQKFLIIRYLLHIRQKRIIYFSNAILVYLQKNVVIIVLISF
jgi:hypothetical protein